MNQLAGKVKHIFLEKFSSTPQIYFSPGRINLIGEHIDYNDGYVMPAAIDKGIYYAVAQNPSNEIHFYSIDFNESFQVNITDVRRMEGWKNYVLGVVNELLILGKPITGFDCVFAGDIPSGAGMSSSAAVEGGLAFALNSLFNCDLNRVELALLCQRAEHTFPQVNCGIMDMYASLNGKKDHVLLLDCKNNTHQYFPLQLDGYKIVLINSKVHHSLADGAYNVRRQRCEEGLQILKNELLVNSFRDIKNADTIEPYKTMMQPKVYNCCKFVVEEIQRTKTAAVLLEQHNLAGFGKLMFDTHEGLSNLYEVSCAELDFLVDEAAKNSNVAGARLMGGGFGGCTINILKENEVADFVQGIADAYKKQFHIFPEAYIIETTDGTRRIDL
jgi:galactokinase